MTIKEFIEKYNNGDINNLGEALEVKDYIPYSEKYELCASVLDACNDIDEKTGMVKIDSINREITFIITVISTYTNLEFSLDENAEIGSIDEYDMLCKNKLIKPIIELFAENYPKDYPEPESVVFALKRGMKVKEIPVVMRSRQGGVSSINPKKSVDYMIKVSLAIILERLRGC